MPVWIRESKNLKHFTEILNWWWSDSARLGHHDALNKSWYPSFLHFGVLHVLYYIDVILSIWSFLVRIVEAWCIKQTNVLQIFDKTLSCHSFMASSRLKFILIVESSLTFSYFLFHYSVSRSALSVAHLSK